LEVDEMKKVLALGAALLLSASPVLATEIGRVLFNGKSIILSDDNTWAYSNPDDAAAASTQPAAFSCNGFEPTTSARMKLALCLDPAEWTANEVASPQQEFLFLSNDERVGLAVLTDSTYYPLDDLHGVILKAAAQSSGLPEDQLQGSEEAEIEANGQVWKGMRYVVPVSGNSFSYVDFHTTDQAVGSVELVLWTGVGDESVSTERGRAIIEALKFGQ
jgi:hypothetical protein